MFISAVSPVQRQTILIYPNIQEHELYYLCMIQPCLSEQWVLYNIRSLTVAHDQEHVLPLYDLTMHA
jgi:hypothetical protein